MSSRIDYTNVYKVQQDIKSIFRNIKLQEKRFTKAIANSHNKFF